MTELPRFAREPEAMIREIVQRVDPTCLRIDVDALLAQVFLQRPQVRELAAVLESRPDLLTSGRAEGPRTVERLIRALRERGAELLVLPRCGDCDEERSLAGLGDGLRICSRCEGRRRVRANPCGICGSINFAGRDREGRPRCRAHPPWGGSDPLQDLAVLIAAALGLPVGSAKDAVLAVDRTRPGQLRLLWALEDLPALLTGRGAEGPARITPLAQALLERGARGVVVPLCPFCERTTVLKARRDALRCCERCAKDDRPRTCAGCGRDRPVGGRTFDGRPLCITCRQADSFNRRPCSNCGTLSVRTTRTADGGLCAACTETPVTTCATCGAVRPCRFAGTDSPLCMPCSAKTRREARCVACGKVRRVNNRTASGEPLCSNCGVKAKPCAGCGKTYRPTGKIGDGRVLCQTCWNKHPDARKPCTHCGSIERLYRNGLCAECARTQDLRAILTGTNDTMRPQLEPVFQALLQPAPRPVLHWIHKVPTRRALLQALAETTGPVTHDVLDRHPQPTTEHLRAALVAAGVLPARDENLARVERWLKRTVARVPNTDERRILHHYASWQTLRRLRQKSAHHRLTHGQADTAQIDIRSAVRLLEWLHAGGITLADCTQDHLDLWLSRTVSYHTSVRPFLLWTARQGHSRTLIAPARSSDFTPPSVAQDYRWTLVRRLVNDETLSVIDRAAGLLLLLFAQPASRIVQLTTDHVVDHERKVTLRLGREPVDLPAPLDDLIRKLVDTRHGRAVTAPAQNTKWLFHSIYPGQPLEPHTLGRRLKTIGISPKAARSAALMDIAADLPAFVFSRLLGFHQATADNWTTEAVGFGADYAADISRR